MGPRERMAPAGPFPGTRSRSRWRTAARVDVRHASRVPGPEDLTGDQAVMGGRRSRGLTASAACCGVPAIFGGAPRATQNVTTEETGVLT